MTSSIYSSMIDNQPVNTNMTANINQISSINQESIDLLTASTKFVPSSSSSGLHHISSSSLGSKHNHLNNLDMDDIDSNDDMYDDDLMDCENNQLSKNYKMNSGGLGGSLMINGSSQMSNNIPNMTG